MTKSKKNTAKWLTDLDMSMRKKHLEAVIAL